MDGKKIITYRPDIDGLRALAVLLVICFHAFPLFFTSGFIGVDIFFVISGFLISGIILKMLKNNEFSYLSFYKSRVMRLFPALLAVLFSCLIVGWFFLFAQEYSFLGQHILFSAGFISNIKYFLESGYFDTPSSLKPLLHLWSLGVEGQFYIFWPILLVFLYKKSKKLLLIITPLLLISFVLNIYVGFSNPNLAFYLPITRFWEFLSGSIVAYINFIDDNFFNNLLGRLNVFKKNKFFMPNFISWFGLLLIFISLLVVNSDNFYKGYVIILVFGVSLIILSGKESFLNRKIFSNNFLVSIGLISYPLYLWHWPLFSFAKIIIGEEPAASVRVLLIALSFILAWTTYTFIEKPLRYSKNKKTVLVLCFLMIFVAILGSTIYINKGFIFRFSAQEKLLKEISLTTSKKASVSLVNGPLDSEKLCAKIYQLKEISNFICMVSDDGPNRIFVIGDSHARMPFEGYKKSLINKGYTLVSLGLAGCSFLVPENIKREQDKEHCNQEIGKAIDLVVNEKPKAVIISNSALYDSNRKYLEFGMDKLLSRLPSNIPIIWDLQTPKVPFSLTKCLKRNIFSKQYLIDCSFSSELFDKRSVEYYRVVERLKKKYPYIILINPMEVLCPNHKCEVIIDNNYMYEDLGSHLSVFGSQYVAEKLPIDKYLPDLKK